MIATERTVAFGLHARPTAGLVNLATSFRARVTVESRGRKPVNARSMPAVMGERIGRGDLVRISAAGLDEGIALGAIDEYLGDAERWSA